MKNYTLRPNPSKILPFLTVFLFTLITTFNLNAQDTNDQKPVRIRYISSAPRLVGEIKRPRIRIVKRASVSKDSNSSLRKLKECPFDLEKKTFGLINQQRAKKGLAPLQWNDKVAKLARGHSENMARHSFFSHTGLNGRTIDQRATDFGLDSWRSIGENIAYNKGFPNPGEFAVERWMISDGHRINLLNSKWKESGIGIAVTEEGKYFFTQIFIVK